MKNSHLSVRKKYLNAMSRRCDARHTLAQAAASSINMLLAYLTAPTRIVVTAALIVGFRNHRRNLDTTSAGVNCHESQVGRTHVLAIVQDVIFHPGLYSHFHRAVKHAIDRGAENYQISNVHRNPEIHVIDRRGHNIVPGMSMRGHGAREVNPMHQTTAKQGAERIGVIR